LNNTDSYVEKETNKQVEDLDEDKDEVLENILKE